MKPETIALHVGYECDPTTKAVAVPIYQTVAFEFDSAEHGAKLFNNEVVGNIYTRIGNPTNAVLEKRVAALEGGVEALGVSSGMAAIEYSIMNIAEAGTNIVATPQLYGASYTLIQHLLPKRGIGGRFAASDKPEDVEKMIDENTRAVYCESVGNPAGNVADIEGLARVAHKHGVPLIVDNTVATPVLLRPIEYGADIIVHSATKFMGGHGTTIGGLIVDSGKFPWSANPDRWYMLTKPEPCYHDLVYTEHFKEAAYVARCRTVGQRNTGASLAPFNAFLLLQGLETMALRVERMSASAATIADFLANHPRIGAIAYPHHPSHPQYELAKRQMSNGSSLIAMDVKGGREAAFRLSDALSVILISNNLGDAKSLITHPRTTTHARFTEEVRLESGITPGLLRLSVGLEDVGDLLKDLEFALDQV
ncbi:MAG TPA: O-acetylhomoserine aminocarboxypropyltransferase/cysteine synthase family protein [Candidatus Acidoferrum sp.]|nr:O-acetylhomoserine aminocarboxypropyltransferase/cysteine synthase family protein [Candidatus Acidoferrum sp.]